MRKNTKTIQNILYKLCWLILAGLAVYVIIKLI